MLCPNCNQSMRRFGFNRNGSQRYRCAECRRSFTDQSSRPHDGRQLSPEKLAYILRILLEGVSVRSTERLTGHHRDTIISAMVSVGEKCERFLERTIKNVHVNDVQVDEIWGFVGCKEKTRERNGYRQEKGDAYCFTAIERDSKLLISWHLGKRCPADTWAFSGKLYDATNGRFQLSTDGFRPYLTAIPATFGNRVDYATIVKVYGTPEDERRYSPATVVDVNVTVQCGNPDDERICTSHVERANLTMRMTIRRLTRLTNAHSKKWDNHSAALALYFAWYNYCRKHSTLGTTPAVEAGLASEKWSVQRLLQEIDNL